jgi:branched-chain amino acid transport system permease protein
MSWLLDLGELCGLNAILALSVYSTLKVGQFSLAQVGFWSIGAYLTGTLTALAGWPLLPALLAGAGLSAVIGLILGYPCLRIRGIYLALATIAFVEVVRVVLHSVEYVEMRNGVPVGPNGALGFNGIPVLTDWPQIFCAIAVLVFIFAWVERSRLGLVTESVREDEVAAACSGVKVVAVKVGMFAFGAAVAAVGGGLYGTYTSFVNADSFGFHLALISIFYVAVGGTNNYLGPILGAVLLTVLPEALRFVGDYRMVAYGALVLLSMLVLPRGLSVAISDVLSRARRAGPAWSRTKEPGAMLRERER